MVAKRALTLDINQLKTLKTQVNNLLTESYPTSLACTVIDNGFAKIAAAVGHPKGAALNFINSYYATLALLETVAPGARVDVSTREEVSGLFRNKKTRLISVRISGKAKHEDTGFTGVSAKPVEDSALALLSAFADALVDLTTRQIAAGANGQVQSVNSPNVNRKGGVIKGATPQTQGGDDLVKERSAASGKSRTPLRPEGFKAEKVGRLAGPTTGSARNPAAKRLPQAPR